MGQVDSARDKQGKSDKMGLVISASGSAKISLTLQLISIIVTVPLCQTCNATG